MGTIVAPSGVSCNVSASDAAINNVPNLRTFLSTSLDTAIKAKKSVPEAAKILDKQVKTIATNPKKYTPQAIQQCTVDLQKAVAEAPNIDVLETLSDTGYMPPDPGNAISVTPQEVQIANYAGPNQYSTPDIQTIVNEMRSGNAKIVDVYGESFNNNGYTDTRYFDKPTGGLFYDAQTGEFVTNGKTQMLEINGKLYAPNNNWAFLPVSEQRQIGSYINEDGQIHPAYETIQTGRYRVRSRADNNVFNEITFTADPDTGQITEYNPNVYQTGSNAGTGFFGGIQEMMNNPVAMIALSFAAPGLGSLIAEEFAISKVAGEAIAKASINIAAGQDPVDAIKGVITSSIIQTGGQSVASDIQKGMQSIIDDKYYALLVGGAIASSLTSAAMAAAQGGSAEDIVKAAAAGAVGSGVATETDSRVLGQAVASGLTGGIEGAAMGAASSLAAEAGKPGVAKEGLGVPLPPAGKVGVTFSTDGAGNAVVMYQDGTTANVQVDPSVQVGSAVSVDPTTNVAQVTALPPSPGLDRMVAGPYRVDVAGSAAIQENPGKVTKEDIPDGYRLATTNEATYLQDKGFSATTLPNGEMAWILPDTPTGLRDLVVGEDISRPEVGRGVFTLPGGGEGDVLETPEQAQAAIGMPETAPEIVYPNIIDITAGYPYKIGQGLDVGVTGGGVAGGLPAIGAALPSTQENVIPDQFSQVSGAGGVGTRDQQIMDLTGIGGGVGGAGEIAGGGAGEISGEVPPAEEIATLPEIEVTPSQIEEEPLSGIPSEEQADKTGTQRQPRPYLITGGISPRQPGRTLGRATTALQTPFERSLITSGLTSYRGAGEIESPESGKRRSNVWNEASLRLKDALGI